MALQVNANDGWRQIAFDGETYEPPRDFRRLRTQLERVRYVLQTCGGWVTLSEIQAITGGSEAGISARVRDLRKAKHGGWNIERRLRRGHTGLWEYRIGPSE